ncbi:MAG: phenylacetate--CoA ligase, partial [Clostridia bacterium]|nr:phenylacetate--CoA ligase [Clostridia bacterium]
MFFDSKIERMGRSEMRALQLDRLKKIVKYAYEKVPFYTKKFDEIGLKPEDIQTLEDIKKIPYTTKADLRDNYPYGLLAVPMDDIVRVHASSGTSGKPTVVAYTKNDLDMWSDCMARLIVAAGGRKSDIVQICFGYGLFTGALGLHQGWEKIGATVIPASSGNTERQVMLMKDLKATALVATPSYGLYISEVMERMGIKKEDINLRIGLFGSEASSPEMHKELQDKLGVFPTDNYGLSEIIGPGVAGECEFKCGMHINEDHFYPEIVDKESLEPLADGEWGELVITTLTKEGLPMLRYRTKDITRLITEKCECGRTTTRMDRIQGRSDDMLIIRGVNVFPSQIEGVLMSIPEIGGNYEIIVERIGHMDKLTINVEVKDVLLLDNYSKLEDLVKKVKQKLKVVLQIDAVVRLVEPQSLK